MTSSSLEVVSSHVELNRCIMVHYHVWFSLKSEIPEAEALAAVRGFIRELNEAGSVSRAMLLRNSGRQPESRLLAYHALFEFADDAQMSTAFAARRTEGIHSGPHGQLTRSIAEMHVEIFREV